MSVKIICVVSTQDEATRPAYQVIDKLNHANMCYLADDKAEKTDLELSLITYENVPIFFTGHGSSSTCIGTSGLAVLDSSVAATNILVNRTIFSLACRTASELGALATKKGNFWFGFERPVSAVPKYSATDKIIGDFFIALFEEIQNFSENKNPNLFWDAFNKAKKVALKSLMAKQNLANAYLSVSVTFEDWRQNLVLLTPSARLQFSTNTLELTLR